MNVYVGTSRIDFLVFCRVNLASGDPEREKEPPSPSHGPTMVEKEIFNLFIHSLDSEHALEAAQSTGDPGPSLKVDCASIG